MGAVVEADGGKVGGDKIVNQQTQQQRYHVSQTAIMVAHHTQLTWEQRDCTTKVARCYT